MKELFTYIQEKEPKLKFSLKVKLVLNFPINKEDLIVERDLDLSGTKVTELPDGLEVYGSLDLMNTNIASLPDNLNVYGYLDISGTKIITLPKKLDVGKWFYIMHTGIQNLPDDLRVGRSICVDHNQKSILKRRCPKFAEKIIT